MMLRFHTQTAGSTLTAQQPENNIIRVAIQALSAILGGTQSLHTNSFDEALSLPSEHSALLALRTQQVIAYESGAADVVDPLGGSYFVENLTDRLETEALKIMKEVEDMGGALSAVEKGYFANEIANSAYHYQQMIEAGEKAVIGLNKFAEKEVTHPEIMEIDLSIEKNQSQKLKSLRSGRDNQKVDKILSAISSSAEKGEPLMPLFIQGAENSATLGEMADALRKVYGEFDSN
jgi:methylmalonyl-CoA mutase N-terminal domain/subunit